MELDLKNLLANPGFARKEKVLLLLATGGPEEKSVKELQELAFANGLRQIGKWNVSQLLKDLGASVVRLQRGWTLTDHGRTQLLELGVSDAGPATKLQPTLRKYAAAISNLDIKAFVEEAIEALERKLYRAAVVLSWVGAVSILYEEVRRSNLAAFNAEATKRFPKWKPAKTADDLALMREHDFLQILPTISVLGKNTRSELEHCLRLRNACGHPNSHKLGELRVATHLEVLLLNVYSKFVI